MATVRAHIISRVQSVNTVWNGVVSEGKQRGAIEEEGCGRRTREWLGAGEGERERGRKVSGAALEREGRAWWAPNEQIMTGSILQDGVNPPHHPQPSTPPSSLLHSSSLLFSLWQFNFPLSPPCSCLLIVSEALSFGPPLAFGPRYRGVWREETGMSKCYLRQQTARKTEVTHNKTGRSSECSGASAAPLTACADKKTRKQRRQRASLISPRFKSSVCIPCKCLKETFSTCFLSVAWNISCREG